MSSGKTALQLWRFLSPGLLGFTLKNAAHGLLDKLQGNPPRPLMAAEYVRQHAQPGSPDDVLKCLDDFAQNRRWLMSVGPVKGPLIQEIADRLPPSPRILELGAYCGYSSIMMASSFGEHARILSIEVSTAAIEASRSNVEVAGLAHQIEFIHGPSTDVIAGLEGSFDLVFLDHWKDLYKQDLVLLEEWGLVRAGTIVVADNVGELFGADEYLAHVRNSGNYDTENRESTIEYTSVADAVEISTHR